MDKVVREARDAISGIADGMRLAVGGFGLCGIPSVLIAALHAAGAKDLEVVSNNCGVDEWGLGVLLQDRRIRRMVSSYVGENKEFARQYLEGELEVVLASPPKEVRVFDLGSGEREYVLEDAIVADFALVRAAVGDRHGNLVFHESARNFNPLCAMAGRVTIAEVEELVEPGDLDPDRVHLPGIYVQRVLPLTPDQAADKRIERRTVAIKVEG